MITREPKVEYRRTLDGADELADSNEAIPVAIRDEVHMKPTLRLVVCQCDWVGESGASAVERLTGQRQVRTLDIDGFATSRRRYVVSDALDLERYTSDIAKNASIPTLAVVVVDLNHGWTAQARRFIYLASSISIRRVVLVVGGIAMDDAESLYQSVRKSFFDFCAPLEFESIAVIPIPAADPLAFDRPSRSSSRIGYSGPALFEYLDSIEISPVSRRQFVSSVESGTETSTSARECRGTVAQGRVAVGDRIRVARSGVCANVRSIVCASEAREFAEASDAVTLEFDVNIDLKRGDVLTASDWPVEVTDQFEASLIWLDAEAGLVGRRYDLRLGAHAEQATVATMTSIKFGIEVDTLVREAHKTLTLHDIAVCNLATTDSVACASFEQTPALGRFVLVDRQSAKVVAIGIIRHSLRRAQNVHAQALTVSRRMREKLNGHCGKVVWLTGLSGSGKSMIGNALEVALHARGHRTYLLDGDNLRQGINKDLGFTDADRVENVRRVIEIARLMMDAGVIVITALISPFRREREAARERLGSDGFVEVFVSTDLATCEQRDVKGLYRRARAGLLPNFSGISSPYEPPEHPDVVIDGGELDLAASTALLLRYLDEREFIAPPV